MRAESQPKQEFAPGFCEGKPRSKEKINPTSMKGRDQRQEKNE
jgi:hypothetical protein